MAEQYLSVALKAAYDIVSETDLLSERVILDTILWKRLFRGLHRPDVRGQEPPGRRVQPRAALAARRAVANFAPALDLCNIARGRIEGLFDNGSTALLRLAGCS
jgi:fructose-1,6-bisphosphatase/inositol monophosphatase family enzyme